MLTENVNRKCSCGGETLTYVNRCRNCQRMYMRTWMARKRGKVSEVVQSSIVVQSKAVIVESVGPEVKIPVIFGKR